FVVRDRVGALYDSLKPLSEHEISMTFIESRPSRRKSWEYYFFVDFLGHLSEENVQESLEGLGEHCQFVKIMGSYPRGGAPD
ncbi:MAG: ACT domain-containing protein, partial [Lentisphaerae bacterium]|nr:ACT domain-containing protein [Lentisphaerota bacterium]